ncbi:Mtf2 domain-containing protein [Fusarium sp. LHS14.1]|nr:Mtf2 domain-containing protein [Fusarium sp. LHS14.1]
MSRNLLPFLYQTRTLQIACRRPVSLLVAQKASIVTQNKRSKRPDNSIPFEWDNQEEAESHSTPEQEGTLTPTESDIFKGIFDEIAQGRLPKANKRPESTEGQTEHLTGKPAKEISGEGFSEGSLIDQARSAQSDPNFLKQFPASLKNAAQAALGKFVLAPARPKLRDLTELDRAEAKQMRVAAGFAEFREKDKLRVETMMKACKTDVELWKLMEEEVFSLPSKLMIEADTHQERKKRKQAKMTIRRAAKKGIILEEPVFERRPSSIHEGKRVMDIHGPLYPHYLSTGMKLLDTAFRKPSALALNILPQVKDLGIESYVLGVSTPLFAKLADIYWKRYGDATAALDALDEMRSVGLHPNEEVENLLDEISSHLHSCTWGAQGPFVMAMTDSPPYDASLSSRLDRWERIIAKSRPRQPEPESELD